MYADDTSFTATYLRRYWKEMVDELRAYAWRTAHRRVLITSNGLLPYVDFNSVGMYPWNPDEQTPTTAAPTTCRWSTVTSTAPSRCRPTTGTSRTSNREIAGDVPVAVFIDWPNDMMTDYLNLPLSEKKDYWRIFGAEAYANGLFPAFHLKDTVGSPDRRAVRACWTSSRTYSRFFTDHRALFRDNDLRARRRCTSGAGERRGEPARPARHRGADACTWSTTTTTRASSPQSGVHVSGGPAVGARAGSPWSRPTSPGRSRRPSRAATAN